MSTIDPRINPCAPPPPRCKSPIAPLFRPGISARRIPECGPNYCDLYGCGGPNWRVTNAGTLDRSRWVEGWISTQLFTRGEVTCEEHPLGKRDGGWWADAFRRDRFKSGSKLWSLKWAPVTNETLIVAKQFALEALQYLLTWGIASRVTVDTRYISRHVIGLQVTVAGPGVSASLAFEGQVTPNAGWLWQEYRGTAWR